MGRLVTSGCYGSLDGLLNASSQPFFDVQSDSPGAKEDTKMSQPVKTPVVSDQVKVSADVVMSPVEKPVQEAPELEVCAAGDQFLHGLGLMLTRWVEAASEGKESKNMNHFYSARPPRIAIAEYLNRIRKYNAASDECYVLALVYIDRASENDPSMAVSELNVHRLLVTAAMLAVKFNDDLYYSNSYYAKVGGVALKELNLLETKFLKALNWKLFVDPKDYAQYHNLVCAAGRQACKEL